LCNSQLFSVAFQSLVDFCFFWSRVCWLLFSSSFVDLGICFNYCLVLLLNWLSAPPLGSRPSPADSLPFLSSNPTSVRVVGGPPGWAWSSNTPLPNRAGTPTKTGPWSSNAPTGQPGGTSLRRDPAHRLWSPSHPSPVGQAPLSGAAHRLGGEC
jgi:hypothetical protein